MTDISFEEAKSEHKPPITEGMNSLQLEDLILGGESYSRSFLDNVPTDPFRWLSDFSPHPSTSSSGTRSIREENAIKLGDIFHNKEQLKDVMKQFALQKGFQYTINKSDTKRWNIRCKAKNCQWYISASKSKVGEVFQIIKMNSTHTCSVDQKVSHQRQVGTGVLGQLIRSKYVLIDRIYRPKEIIVDIADRYKIDISYSQAWRARNWALNSLKGSPEESFMLLPDYCYNLQRSNPGTVTAIETDDAHRFKYFFMALGCSICAFRKYLRPVICIDAAFLKSQYLGHLFFAVGRDGNNQIYPIGFGVGKKEDHDTWCWFLRKIKECIHEIPELVIISDRHHAIYSAMVEVFPNVHHEYCCHHLLCNMRAKYKQNSKVVGAYWKAAKSYTETNFKAMMQSLDTMNPQAGAYLREVGFERWSRAHFSEHRYNIMTTNIAESFNDFVKHARGLPITMLAEFIRGTLQRWFYERRNHANKCPNFVTPWMEEKISRRLSKSARLKVRSITPHRYQVIAFGGYMGIVDSDEMSCTCKKFQLSHIPCEHVVAVTRYMSFTNVNTWVHPFFQTEFYRAIYEKSVNPLGNQLEWLYAPEERVILPPVFDS
ncbi:uncharacterized protein LOC123197816 [Mangifera indica]|uniref:uncharacterized protein LOC123197816 n=1 Tax=Mangifera indica TaxID=29780 RepID=UPI001CFAA9A3|nr:uncharacterized protein LOC123197816 [Mangifera indica]